MGFNRAEPGSALPGEILGAIPRLKRAEFDGGISKSDRSLANLFLAKTYLLKSRPDSARIYLERSYRSESKGSKEAEKILKALGFI